MFYSFGVSMKKVLLGSFAALAMLFASCTTFTPVCADGTIGAKRGSSSGTSVLWGLMNFGNGSILDAAEDSGITHVSTVDVRTTNILGGFVIVKTTLVSGE